MQNNFQYSGAANSGGQGAKTPIQAVEFASKKCRFQFTKKHTILFLFVDSEIYDADTLTHAFEFPIVRARVLFAHAGTYLLLTADPCPQKILARAD